MGVRVRVMSAVHQFTLHTSYCTTQISTLFTHAGETAFGCEPRWDERRAPAVMPLLPEVGGALLCFDYRCYHRGCANHSDAARPVGYVAFSTRPGVVSDAHNFPKGESLLVAAAAAATVVS